MLLSIPNRLVLLPDEHTARLKQIFPKVGRYKDYAVLPHKVETSIILRNIGHEVPSPILTQYDWPIRAPFAPFKHQKTTAAFFTLNRRAFCLNDLGTGKTLSAYWAADFLMREGLVRRALVVSPLSTLERVHAETLWQNFVGDSERTFTVLHGAAAKRKQLLKHDFDFYIINHDGVKVIEKALIERPDIDLVILDECAVYRNVNERWKALKRILRPDMWVWGMTGTPTPNEPTDAWAQIKLIRPEGVDNHRSLRAFRDATMRQINMFKWVPRDDSVSTVQRLMVPAIRFTRDECLDLPECTYTTLDVELTDGQKQAYKSLMNSFTAEVGGGKVTALNEGIRLMRLIQVVSGVVYDVNGAHRRIDCLPRLTALSEIIEEAPAKVIVFSPFKGNQAFLQEKLAKHWSAVVVNGDTPRGQRNEIFRDFESPRGKIKVLNAHPECMAHGLNLVEAATIVWWAPIASNEIYEQANGRINRAGQKRRTSVFHLSGTKVERDTYRRLQTRQKLQGLLLSVIAEASKPVDKRF